LTDGRGNLVCSCHCSSVAYERRQKKKRIKDDFDEHCDNQRKYQEKCRKKKSGEKRKPRYTKPVNVIKKADGSIMARHPSVRAASEATGISTTTISQVCRGEVEMRGDYTFAYAEQQQDTGGNAIWDRPTIKAVVQLDLRGNLIARHGSQKAAALSTGVSQASVSLCCRHKQYQSNGFIFMFEQEYEEKKGN
jgi:uncharacterized protein YerC